MSVYACEHVDVRKVFWCFVVQGPPEYQPLISPNVPVYSRDDRRDHGHDHGHSNEHTKMTLGNLLHAGKDVFFGSYMSFMLVFVPVAFFSHYAVCQEVQLSLTQWDQCRAGVRMDRT